MKTISYILILLLFYISACKSSKLTKAENLNTSETSSNAPEVSPPIVNFAEQSTWLLGYFNLRQLKSEPYSTWFIKGYDSYNPNNEVIDKLKKIRKDDLTIKIVMGTWCPDSRREVPRFMRILDLWQFPLDKVIFIGVDDNKISPVGEYGELDIQRVPTFIIYIRNIEAGRIIENPVTSLEQDMVNIITRNE